jgi:anti-anti-sigma factor
VSAEPADFDAAMFARVQKVFDISCVPAVCSTCDLSLTLWITFLLFLRPIFGHPVWELFFKVARMNRHMELSYQIECLQDVAIVGCSGRLVRGAALDEFRSHVERLENLRVLVLDLSQVEQLDAGGLGALLLLRRGALQKKVQLKLVNPSRFVRRVLDATHLNSVFEISSLEEALCILRSPEGPPRYAVA